MGDKAIEAISGVLSHSGYDAGRMYGSLAQDILAALNAAGYAVVELPEPKELGYSASTQVLIGGEPEDVYLHDGDISISGLGTVYADEARDLAAALLAAANAAEAVTHE